MFLSIFIFLECIFVQIIHSTASAFDAGLYGTINIVEGPEPNLCFYGLISFCLGVAKNMEITKSHFWSIQKGECFPVCWLTNAACYIRSLGSHHHPCFFVCFFCAFFSSLVSFLPGRRLFFLALGVARLYIYFTTDEYNHGYNIIWYHYFQFPTVNIPLKS